jgi:hypothetical protein
VNDVELPEHVRTCVIASVRDVPERVTRLAVALQRQCPMLVTVLVHITRPPLASSLRVVGPAGGAGLAAAIAASRQADSAQEQLQAIEQTIQQSLPESHGIKTGSVSGSSRRSAMCLCEEFDLLVMPRRLGPVGLLRRVWPGPHLKLALASHAPTLFCAELPPWDRLIVVDFGDRASWLARHALTHLADRFRFGLSVVRPEEPSSGGSSGDDQGSRCLVLSLPAVRRIFASQSVSGLLRDWNGDCLLWP